MYTALSLECLTFWRVYAYNIYFLVFASSLSKKGKREEWQKFIARKHKVEEGLMEVFANWRWIQGKIKSGKVGRGQQLKFLKRGILSYETVMYYIKDSSGPTSHGGIVIRIYKSFFAKKLNRVFIIGCRLQLVKRAFKKSTRLLERSIRNGFSKCLFFVLSLNKTILSP